MNKTKIEWCDMTWNPVTGCQHGCEYCYARKIAQRFGGHAETGERHVIVSREGAAHKAVPFPFGFDPTFYHYRLKEPQTIKKPQTIFVCSMADLFGEWVPDEWIERVFQACEKAPWHRYLFLTKNPQRLCSLANTDKLPKNKNFWYGSTLDNASALRYPGRFSDNTFVSIEPLTEFMNVGLGSFGSAKWVIIGAETGNRKGKVTPQKEWVDNICEAAAMLNRAVFMKDSLIPIVGEANMRREFPWDVE
jgi:protein gp37